MNRTVATALAIAVAAVGVADVSTFAAPASAATVAESVCGSGASGHAHCDAALLVAKGTHKLIRPTVSSRPPAGRSAHTMGSAVDGQPSPGSPQWLQQAYDLTSLSATQGTGDTVAIVDADSDPGAASDLATYRSTYGLPACTPTSGCLQIVNEAGATSPLPAANSSWSIEETLDLDAVSAICPNCNILLIEANSSGTTDLQKAMQTAVDLGANQISDSWSVTAGGSPFGALATKGGSALPPVFAAAGDAGADPAGSAEYPAALPTVTAVGGTTLSETNSTSAPRGYSESAWSDTGSGCATAQPALSYQPSTGCDGRAYSDVSADANPDTGLDVYEAADGGWAAAGGTSLATPMVAAFTAITGINAETPQWAYTDAPALNASSGGSNGQCAGLAAVICTSGAGYSGPTGAGFISGAVVAGAPGIAGPTFINNGTASDVASVSATFASLSQGLYANNEATTYSWQYGTTSSYGSETAPATLAAGADPASVSGHLGGLSADTTYHYRLVATNASGTSYGYDLTFTTSGSTTVSAPQAQGSTPSLSSSSTLTSTGSKTSVTPKKSKTAETRAKQAAKAEKAQKARAAAKARKTAKVRKAKKAAKAEKARQATRR